MASDAEIPRVTGGTAHCDGGCTRCAARHSCELAVTAEQKIRCIVRTGTRKAGNVRASQTWRVREAHVTGRACLARNIHVRTFQAVTAEALFDDGSTHNHPRRSWLVVTRGAVIDHPAVSRILHVHRACMILMGEAQVPGPRTGPGRPRYSRLNHAIVTRRAAHRLWPHRLTRLRYACMASRTEWKDLRMLVMRECSLWCTGEAGRGEQRSSDENAKKRRPHAAHERHRFVGRAGGSGVRSAPDPNAMLTPARTRS